jgi:hypothetical protein
MLVKHEILPDEPIIIFKFDGIFTVNEMLEMYTICEENVDKLGGRGYRIGDYTECISTFPDLLDAIQKSRNARVGNPSDPRFIPVMVGTNAWVKLASDLLSKPQFANIRIPIFTSVEDALAAVRVMEEQRKNNAE